MHSLSLWTVLSICGPLTAAYISWVDDVGPASGRNLVQVQVQSKAEMMAAVRAYYSHLGPRQEEQTTSWKPYRYFPSMPPQPPGLHPSLLPCKNIGRQYPPLVSRNLSIVQRYDRYACDKSHNDTFVTDPLVALAAEMTHLEGGCINMNRWPSRILAANSSHSINLRTCGEKCDQNLTGLAPVLVDEDMLVISSAKLPAGMEYQHMLLDFLPAAWTLTKHLKSSNMKLVTHIPLQKAIIAYLGIPEEKVLELPFPKEGRFLLCTPKLLHLWRVGPGDSTPLPTSKYTGQYGDLWHRLLVFRVGPDLSNAIAKAVHLDSQEEGNQITFLHRCVADRQIFNEASALAATSKVLLNRKRPEKLVSTCTGRQTWLNQLVEVRKSALLIGAYGGAMANTVFMRHGTGIIEIVNSPDTQLSQLNDTGHWPPYKSHWFGGAGAVLPFFKVVLYEANENGELVVRLDDLEEALQQWFDYRPLQNHHAGPLVLPSG